jgi:hypothetical protein
MGVARSAYRLIGAWSKPLLGITGPLIAESFSARRSSFHQATGTHARDDGDGLPGVGKPLEQSPQFSFYYGSYSVRFWRAS